MINQNFVIVGSIIFFLFSVGYVLDTIKGKIKPNRVTWFLWALAPLIAFIAEIKQGVGIQSLLTLTVVIVPTAVFIASFLNKKSYWKIEKFDLICGAFSILGLVLWYITKTGNIAIFFSILADFMAGVPTIVKSFKYPETENYFLYVGNAAGALITLLTITVWDFATYAFPLYVFFLTFVIAILVKTKIGKVLKR